MTLPCKDVEEVREGARRVKAKQRTNKAIPRPCRRFIGTSRPTDLSEGAILLTVVVALPKLLYTL
jgi:hypothetical protein